jgi:ankyrin repeat protein
MNIETLEQYIQAGDSQALRLLLDEYRGLAKATTSYSVSPVMLACYHKKPVIVSLLLGYLDSLTLFEAAAIGNIEAVRFLLENYSQLVNQLSADGFTALGLACFFAQTE